MKMQPQREETAQKGSAWHADLDLITAGGPLRLFTLFGQSPAMLPGWET
jgi:hypothetical protein